MFVRTHEYVLFLLEYLENIKELSILIMKLKFILMTSKNPRFLFSFGIPLFFFSFVEHWNCWLSRWKSDSLGLLRPYDLMSVSCPGPTVSRYSNRELAYDARTLITHFSFHFNYFDIFLLYSEEIAFRHD